MPGKSAKTNKKVVKTSAKKQSSSPFAQVKSFRSALTSVKVITPGQALIILLIAAGILVLYLLRPQYEVAQVNGFMHPITRLQVFQESEQQAGKQVLSTLVDKELIMQEAKKRGITVSDSEVNKEIDTIEANLKQSGQTIDQVLASQNMTIEGLKENIQIQKLIEKMIGKSTTVSDKEVDDYLAKNKDMIPQGQDPKSIRASIKQNLEQQKLSEKYQGFIDDLHKKANIKFFRTY
jgi:foldase protein PrsA